MLKNVCNEPEALAERRSESSQRDAILASYILVLNILEFHSWEIGQRMPNSTLHWQIDFQIYLVF